MIYKQGINTDEFVSALKQIFPKNDPRPEQFRDVLEKFHQYHHALYEWKELHNALDDILGAFGQFNSEIQRADADNVLPQMKLLRNSWRAVSTKVDALQEFGTRVQFIGSPYKEDKKGIHGEQWVVQITTKRNEIGNQLGLGETHSKEVDLSPMDGIVIRGQFRLGIKPDWWFFLIELTNDFNHLLYGHIHLADKRLRESANELYMLSKSAFGR